MTAGHPAATADVVVVGGGPAGATAAIQLARVGRRVIIVERSVAAHKPCGGLLTPRAVASLHRLQVSPPAGAHRIDHVRFTFQTDGEHHVGGRAELPSTSVRWPADPDSADHALVVARPELNRRLLDEAVRLGVQLLDGHTATAPIVERGFVRGAQVTDIAGTSFEIRATYIIVADGANSRFGRALGTFRRPSWPLAVAQRAIFRSTLHDASEIELVAGLRDRAGTPVTGYGFMFPGGDDTVTVGTVVMSTSPSFQVINMQRLLDQVIADHGERWQLDSASIQHPVVANAGGRIPTGSSVGPQAGPTFLVVGDAAGASNPLSGAGIEYAIETGVIAGDVVAEALTGGSATALQQYPKAVQARYGTYFKVGRLTTRILGNPSVHRRLAKTAATSPSAAAAYLRFGGNQLRPGRLGPAELAYRTGRAISRVAPDA
ncbi:MAG TPA: geranylgeranyl reductase family protein [Ilumatobacter sp.]|nr:geranylgeranyl reductase family protein [Ilumatobacter sp.]